MAEPKTLTSFLNELKERGIRKQNQFQLLVTTGTAEIDDELQNLTMWASTATLPTRTQEFTDVFYHGYPFKLPTRLGMDQTTSLSIKSDSDGIFRRAFLAWMGKVSNPAITDGSIMEGEKKINTSGNIRMIFFKDDMETVSETYKLVGCVPSSVGGLLLSNESADISTFDVELTFQYFELEEAEGAFSDIR
tara:strand:+ start:2486 stop:3058 length:573 start_codon:yes stop_codon:yes gene_type:complete